MNDRLLQRRETLLKSMIKTGDLYSTVKTMVQDIPDSFDREKAANAIRADWNRRDKWLNHVVRINEGTFLTELVAGMDEAVQQCWAVYTRTKNDNAKIGALRTVIGGKSRMGLLLMKAGVIQQAPQYIETNMTIAGTPFDVDPQFRAALLGEADKQRVEKQNAATQRTPDPGQK